MMHLCYSYMLFLLSQRFSTIFPIKTQDRSWTPSFFPPRKAAEEFGASRASQLDGAHAYSSEYLVVFGFFFLGGFNRDNGGLYGCNHGYKVPVMGFNGGLYIWFNRGIKKWETNGKMMGFSLW